MKFVERNGLYLDIYSRGKSKKFVELIKKYRAVYHSETNLYSIIYTVNCWIDFENMGFYVPEYIKLNVTKSQYMQDKLLKVVLPKNITKDLYPFQIEGVKMLEAGWNFLGDMQGLGKTPQACRFMELHKEYTTNIIICPGFLKEKWQDELHKWTTKKTKILYGREVEKLESGVTYIINYDILSYKLKSFDNLDLDCVSADEVHYCKSGQTQRTRAMNVLAKKAKTFIPITGTPILNNPDEIYNVLNIVAPTLFYSKSAFQNQYCIMEFKYGENRFVDSKNEDQLYRILKESILIRRNYEEVKYQFGDTYKVKIEQKIIPIKLDSYEEYNFADKDLYKYIEKNQGIARARKLASTINLHRPRILKEIIYENKKNFIFNWVDRHLEKGEKICLFFKRTAHLDEFVKKYGRQVLKINGETETEKRFEKSKMFNQSRRLNLICGNILACGVGLDLIGSHIICFVDFDWNFSNMEQVIKRADRFGQKNNVVYVYYFAGENTIEDSYLMSKLDKKNNISKKIIDGRRLKDNERFRNGFK